MEGYFKSEDDLLEAIVAIDGDCINTKWCIMCPFQARCVGRAITEAKLLPKEDRARLAYERLFNKLLEDELSDYE